MVEVDELYKAFEEKQVLEGVTCQIPAGKISVVMGPSGTGKSVLLRHIVGLLYPDRGDVRVAGKSVPNLNEDELLELRRNVGMLFQDGALFSSMNLYDNVAFPLRQHTKKSETEVKEIVMQRLEEVGLADAVKKMPNELSGGMRKRTALLCDLIKEIQQKYKSTGIVISHDIKSCFNIGDHIILLHGGKVVDQGSKEELQKSNNPFTQQFIKGAVEGPLGME
jgi:phospholipid/cholesterol/gamma-HCH transport system ATP-binding protein